MKKLLMRAVLPLLGVLIVVYTVLIPRETIHRPNQPIEMSPSDVGLDYEDLVLQPSDQSLQLAGWWMPAQQPGASLVFVHGGGSNRHSQFFRALDFYRALVTRGISVLAIDLRNHGASGSDGRGLGFGATEKYDAMAAIAWLRNKTPQLPVYAMGISMGGATLIQAVSEGSKLDGLILLDPVLDTASTLTRGAHVETGLPAALFQPAAWAATTFYGLPGGNQQALDKARSLTTPTLLLQDPDDPVTAAEHARSAAASNTMITLWEAPTVDPDNPELPWRERWGSHVIAFTVYPQQTLQQIMDFIAVTGRSGPP